MNYKLGLQSIIMQNHYQDIKNLNFFKPNHKNKKGNVAEHFIIPFILYNFYLFIFYDGLKAVKENALSHFDVVKNLMVFL